MSRSTQRTLTLLGSTVLTAPLLVLGGGAAVANQPVCPVPPDTSQDVWVNVCYDLHTEDPDPSTPGANVVLASSVTVYAFGPERICTGYYSAGGQVDLDASPLDAVVPHFYVEGLPHTC